MPKGVNTDTTMTKGEKTNSTMTKVVKTDNKGFTLWHLS